MASQGMNNQNDDRQQQAGGKSMDPTNKGKKGQGQGGQSGKTQNGQNMQKRDGRH